MQPGYSTYILNTVYISPIVYISMVDFPISPVPVAYL